MREKRLILILILIFYVQSIVAQDKFVVKGIVVDSSNSPIELAIVYAYNTADSSFLGFSNTQANGQFELPLTKSFEAIDLNITHLNYLPRQIVLKKNELQIALKVIMQVKNTALEEVIVSVTHPQIVEKGDTISYRLSSFRDSTEYSVEDALKKLPGIQIDENGQIKFNGKAVDKVLIEGTDMFGRQYTMGTKNIRADYIEQVDVIKRFEDNPVLKNIKNSDAIALNLKMSKNKKNVVSGTLNGGIGAGLDEGKAAAHINLFAFNKKFKSILLNDNGNEGQHYGIDEILATYTDFDAKNRDLKSPYAVFSEFSQTPKIENPGLSRAYIDNALNTFSTLRNNFDISENTKLGLNLTYNWNKDLQNSALSQGFLYNQNTYALQINQLLERKNEYYDANLNLDYVSDNKKNSLSFYTQKTIISGSSIQNISKNALVLKNIYNTKQDNWINNALFSKKIGQSSVYQCQLMTQIISLPEYSQLQNNDFRFFSQSDSLNQLYQNIQFNSKIVSFSNRIIKKWQKIVSEIEGEFVVDNADFVNENTFKFLNEAVDKYDKKDYEFIKSNTFNGVYNLIYAPNTKHMLKATMKYGYKNVNTDTTFSLKTKNIQFFWNFQENKIGEFRVGYNWLEDFPNNIDFIKSPYFTGAFTRINSVLKDTALSKHELYGSFVRRNPFKFRNFYINTRFTLNQNIWSDDILFNNSFQVIKPVFTTNNHMYSGNIYFNQFFPKVKTALTFTIGYYFTKSNYIIENQENTVINKNIFLNPSLNITVTNRLKLNLYNRLQLANLRQLKTNDKPIIVINNTLNAEILYDFKQFRISTNINNTVVSRDNKRIANLTGSHFRVSYKLANTKNNTELQLYLYNLSNAKKYVMAQNDNYLFFNRSIEAVRSYALVKIDMSL
jgi:hypothetical protein